MITKAGLGLIGLGAISVGGVALAKPGWLGMGKDPMPSWHSLSEDNNFETVHNDTSKFGKKYGRYLVGVTNKKDSDPQHTNENWWKWAFEKMSKDISSSKFSTKGPDAKVGSGYGETNSLRKVCEEAYKLTDDTNNFVEDNTDGTKHKKSEVWKYCSIGGTQPQTIKEFNTGKTNAEPTEEYSNSEGNAIAKDDAEKGKFLSIKSPANNWIWDLKDKEFRNTTIDTDGYFKTEKDKAGAEKKTLKEICEEAYGKAENKTAGGAKLEKTDVTKYCSLEQTTS